MHTDDPEITEHYRDQVARLRIMALLLGGAELKANLRAAARIYEGLAEKLEKHARPAAGIREGSGTRYTATLH
jgi:hypothetical protein